MERVFKALADPTRRKLLDALRRKDGQTLGELEKRFEMSRFGVMKHLRILEAAGLVITRKVGREKLHYLNSVPIRSIHDRWISKYAAPWAAAMNNLKGLMEERMEVKRPRHIFQIWIRTTPEALWDAITNPEITKQYFHGSIVVSDWKPGSAITYLIEGEHALDGSIIECNPPHRLVVTFQMTYNELAKGDRPTRVSWEIEQLGDLCKLTLLHDDFDGETTTYREVASAAGWPYILSSLKTLLETGTAMKSATEPL